MTDVRVAPHSRDIVVAMPRQGDLWDGKPDSRTGDFRPVTPLRTSFYAPGSVCCGRTGSVMRVKDARMREVLAPLAALLHCCWDNRLDASTRGKGIPALDVTGSLDRK